MSRMPRSVPVRQRKYKTFFWHTTVTLFKQGPIDTALIMR